MCTYTYAHDDFPDGWKDESSLELLERLLAENGFPILSRKELHADKTLLDARPHSDIYTVSRDGKLFSFQLDATRDLRHGREYVDSIRWLRAGDSPVPQVKFTVPPDMDTEPVYAAIEYWVRDLSDYASGRQPKKRTFDTKKWERIRQEEHLKAKRRSDERYRDYLENPGKYPVPPPRVVPTAEPKGIYFALRFLYQNPHEHNQEHAGEP